MIRLVREARENLERLKETENNFIKNSVRIWVNAVMSITSGGSSEDDENFKGGETNDNYSPSSDISSEGFCIPVEFFNYFNPFRLRSTFAGTDEYFLEVFKNKYKQNLFENVGWYQYFIEKSFGSKNGVDNVDELEMKIKTLEEILVGTPNQDQLNRLSTEIYDLESRMLNMVDENQVKEAQTTLTTLKSKYDEEFKKNLADSGETLESIRKNIREAKGVIYFWKTVKDNRS